MASDSSEPLRRTQSEANNNNQPLNPFPLTPPMRAPKLMLVNGLGEVSSIPSPIVGRPSDDEDSAFSEPGTPVREHSPPNQLFVPSIFDSPVKPRQRDYSPSISPMKPPPSPPRRSLSPVKMINSNEGKPKPNQRRGHHHKHSLSHQIFLPPPERPPLPLPSSLPAPTYPEVLSQLQNMAVKELLPLFANGLALLYVFHSSTGESSLLALTFLSLTHLIASFVHVISKTMGTFDIWRTTTLRHPFGLQRIESLSEFALAVLSTFNGLYILKETFEDIVISFGAGEVLVEGSGSHHHHHHYVEPDPQRITSSAIDIPVLMLMLTTLSLVTNSNHTKSILRIDYLTLFACVVILMIPILGVPPLHSIDRAISLCISFAMMVIGLQMGKKSGEMLLFHPPRDEKGLVKQISGIGGVMSVEKTNIFLVSEMSGVALFTIRIVDDGESAETAIRERIGRLLNEWEGNIKWDYFVDFQGRVK